MRFFDTRPISANTAKLAEEIGGLIALASDRRVEVALEIPIGVEGRPATEKHMLPLGPVADRRARGPFDSRVRTEFINLASRVRSLDDAQRKAIGAAIDLHYGALLLSEQDLRSAYVLLVAALELLSRAFGHPPTDWRDWDRARAWDEIFQELKLTPDQANGIRAEMMKNNQIRLKATFRDYTISNLPAEFWDGDWHEWHRQIKIKNGKSTWGANELKKRPMNEVVDREILRIAIGHTYDLRSGAVHRGKAVELFDVTVKGEEKISPKEPLPYALLRLVVRTLILEEIRRRTTVKPLADVRVVKPTPAHESRSAPTPRKGGRITRRSSGRRSRGASRRR